MNKINRIHLILDLEKKGFNREEICEKLNIKLNVFYWNKANAE